MEKFIGTKMDIMNIMNTYIDEGAFLLFLLIAGIVVSIIFKRKQKKDEKTKPSPENTNLSPTHSSNPQESYKSIQNPIKTQKPPKKQHYKIEKPNKGRGLNTYL